MLGKKLKEQQNQHITMNMTDRAIWHSGASLVFPAFTIHTIVDNSKKLLMKSQFRSPNLGATFLGLVSIPLIIHPIDHFTDWLMDNTLRRIYVIN